MRLFAFIVSLLTISTNTWCQNYFQFIEQYKTTEGVIIFKDEIYKVDSNKNVFHFGDKEYILDNAKIEPIQNITDRDLDDTKNRIKIAKSNDSISYSVDVSGFSKNNQIIKFIRHDNSIVELNGNTPELININNAGDYFRILIPNKPSIIFSKGDKFNYYKEKNLKDQVTDDDSGLIKYLKKLTLWHYLIGILILVAIVVAGYLTGIVKFFYKKKYPILKKYESGDLHDFAYDAGISREELIRYNKKELKGYLDLKTKNEKQNLKKSLRGKELIIGYSETPIINEPKNGDGQNIKIPESQFGEYEEIPKLLIGMEQRILNRISSLASNKEAAQKIENLQKELEKMRLNNKQLDGEILRVSNDNETYKLDIQNLNIEKQTLSNELVKYTEKIIHVDYLEPYAKTVKTYYEFCNQGFVKAADFYEQLSTSNSFSTNIVGYFLLKFMRNSPSVTTKWVGIINEIAESKTTANQELIRSLKQIPNNEEKTLEFKRILLKEVFEKYSSNMLILTEELKNLSKFTNESETVNQDFEKFFMEFSKELRNKIISVGLDLNYVPLFDNYNEYVAHTRLVSKESSYPYRNIKGLSKDSVLEIVDYGFGTKETNVIVI